MAYLFEEPTSRMYNVCGIAIFLGIGLDRLIQNEDLRVVFFKESLLLSLTCIFFLSFFHIKVQSLWQGLGMTIGGLEGDGGLVIGWLLPVD